MIDYEKLKFELNQYALYLLNSLNRDYGAYFSLKNQKKLNKMLKSEDIVEIDSIVDNKKIHINPNYEIFKMENYNEIKKYFLDNYLINALLNCFITLSIPEKKFTRLKEPNENQSCCIYLRKGLISYIGLEFAKRSRLEEPEIYSMQCLEFIKLLEKLNLSIKSYAFLDDYLDFKKKFYDDTNKDILDYYKIYKSELKNMKNLGEIEVLEVDDYDTHNLGR
jgi:hypothetical protein